MPSQPNNLPKRRKPVPIPDSECSDLDQPETGDETVTTKGKPAVKKRDIQGLKYLDMIAPLLEKLHDDRCDRDTALRSIPQASELAKVKKGSAVRRLH